MSDQQSQGGQNLDLRIGCALNDYLQRRAQGTAEPEEEFIARHSDWADDLRAHLDLLRDLEPTAKSLTQLIAQGVLEPGGDSRYPARLGPYQVAEFVGRGGMGVVLKAYEERLQRWVALKIVRPELADDAAALARFTREARAAAALRHLNIVTVYTVGQERHVHYLALEFIDGPTLAGVIRAQGPLPAETMRAVFRQLLSGLAAAHKAGLIHRDIKPSNILLDNWGTRADSDLGGTAEESGPQLRGAPRASARAALASFSAPERWTADNGQSPIVKLADFGLARMLSAQTRVTLPQSLLGTPEYMSPEQARGTDELDQRSDLYSAGVVLYEMLTGTTPFKADTPAAVIHRILHEAPRPPRQLQPNADPHLASLTLRLLAKRPEDRFESAEAALAALDSGTRVAVPERRRRATRRSIVATCCLALVCAGMWLLGQSLGSRVITDVRVEMIDGEPATTILARYENSSDWEFFCEFPREAHHVTAVTLVDLHGRGTTSVVAGVYRPIDGKCLFAFDPRTREEIWSKELSSDFAWPDCAESPGYGCRCLTARDLDEQPGDEIVVATGFQDQYPTRVSILDPRTGEVGPTFWHMGGISQLQVAQDFLAPGRPAIIALGSNNKLDGFQEKSETDAAPFTCWDVVHVVMVLDPQDMNGLGPPHTDRVPGVPPSYPWAYAFLDLAASQHTPDICGDRQDPRFPRPEEIGQITNPVIEPCTPDEHGGSCIRLELRRPEMERGNGLMIVDHNLEFRANVEDWSDVHNHWRPIIQNGEYLTGEPARRPGGTAAEENGPPRQRSGP